MTAAAPTEPEFFKNKALFTKTPVIHEVGSLAFYTCGYTGAPCTQAVGIPGFILGKKATDKAAYGRFKNWNVVFRMLTEAVQEGACRESDLASVSSWFAENWGNQQIQMAPSRSKLARFGGEHSDEEYDLLYTHIAHNPFFYSSEASAELTERMLNKAPRSSSANPTLASTIKELASEEGVEGPTFFEAAVWPRVPGFFAVRRVEKSDLEGTVCQMLDVQLLPHQPTSPASISGPSKYPKTVEAWLDKKCRPAKLAAAAASKKLESERKKRERLARKAEKRPAHLGASAAPKKKSSKVKNDMASFAKAAAELVSQ